jgi:hydrogenase expression/formation protein HypC
MCLGIPGRIIERYQERELLMGKVEFGGVRKQVCLEHTPEAAVGDYVVVHVGFALSVIQPDEARQVFEFLEALGEIESGELGAEDDGERRV